jgi:hypothetical protein
MQAVVPTRINRRQGHLYRFSAKGAMSCKPGALPQVRHGESVLWRTQGGCCAVGAEYAQTGLSASLLTCQVAHR